MMQNLVLYEYEHRVWLKKLHDWQTANAAITLRELKLSFLSFDCVLKSLSCNFVKLDLIIDS